MNTFLIQYKHCIGLLCYVAALQAYVLLECGRGEERKVQNVGTRYHHDTTTHMIYCC